MKQKNITNGFMIAAHYKVALDVRWQQVATIASTTILYPNHCSIIDGHRLENETNVPIALIAFY